MAIKQLLPTRYLKRTASLPVTRLERTRPRRRPVPPPRALSPSTKPQPSRFTSSVVFLTFLGLSSLLYIVSVQFTMISHPYYVQDVRSLSGVLVNFKSRPADRGLVHIVQTKVPGSLNAEAQLKLLDTVTLPSLAQQTTKEFLWIIKVDANLDASVHSSLLSILEPMDNMVVLVEDGQLAGFRGNDAYSHSNRLIGGNWPLLQTYLESSTNHTVVSTNLDVGDAVSKDYLYRLQADVQKHVRYHVRHYCADKQLEWQEHRPWPAKSVHQGALVRFALTPGADCLPAGLSTAIPVGADEVDAKSSTEVPSLFPKCSLLKERTCYTLFHPSKTKPSALRARTLVSMDQTNLVLQDSGVDGAIHWTGSDKLAESLRKSKSASVQTGLWRTVESNFGIDANSMDRLYDHLKSEAEPSESQTAILEPLEITRTS